MSAKSDVVSPGTLVPAVGRSSFPATVAVPLVVFGGALVTDVVFARSANTMWQNFSIWLITAGLIVGGLTFLLAAIGYVTRGRRRNAGAGGFGLLLFLAALLVSFLNAFVHSRDGWTAVVPEGLVLSVVAVILFLMSGVVAVSASNRPFRGGVR